MLVQFGHGFLFAVPVTSLKDPYELFPLAVNLGELIVAAFFPPFANFFPITFSNIIYHLLSPLNREQANLQYLFF
jgi:hypothetical protein